MPFFGVDKHGQIGLVKFGGFFAGEHGFDPEHGADSFHLGFECCIILAQMRTVEMFSWQEMSHMSPHRFSNLCRTLAILR